MHNTLTDSAQQNFFDEALRLHHQGYLDEAERHYQHILSHAPQHNDALRELSLLYIQQGRYQNALDILEEPLQPTVASAELFYHKGLALHHLQRHNEALIYYDKALSLKPGLIGALHYCGILFYDLERFEDALIALDKEILLNPNAPEIFNQRGNILQRLKRYNEALADYASAIALKPDYADAFNNQGQALKHLERFEEALTSFNASIALKPDSAQTFNNRGNTFQGLHRFNEAITDYTTAIALKPNYADAFNNRGQALKRLKRFEDALLSYNQALTLTPRDAQILCNRSDALRNLHRFGEALANYDHALTLEPDNPTTHFNKSLCELLLGNYSLGWQGYEWRLQLESFSEKISLGRAHHDNWPQWHGDITQLKNKTLLLHTEQGLGDTLQFCRYAPEIAKHATKVVLEVVSNLHTLMMSLDGDIQVMTRGDSLPHVDLQCSLMSLPLALGTTLDTIPNTIPYLAADPTYIEIGKNRLGAKTRPRVGLAWSGNPKHAEDNNRSIAFEKILTLTPLPIDFYCLQRDIRDNDKDALKRSSIHDLSEHIETMADTAALVSEMDIIISVDTALAHLAGALGKPVWILLPYVPDWRWLLKREDSPWYPTALLFRQPSHSDWDNVINRVFKALLGTVLTDYGHPEPNDVETLYHLGIQLQNTGQQNKALQCFERVIELNPNHAEAFNDRGTLLQAQGHYNEALHCYGTAISLKPSFAQAFNNQGALLYYLERFDEAQINLQQAVTLKPDFPEALNNLGLCELLLGNYADGWKHYESRLQNRVVPLTQAHLNEYPTWAGPTHLLEGKTILLHTEQGLGDALQFCRYAKEITKHGAHVVLEVVSCLKTLLQSLDPSVQVITRGEPIPHVDLQSSLMSLPLAFNTTLDTIPNTVPYLAADPKDIERWKNKLGPQTRPRIGLAWSGNPNHANDINRSIPLAKLQALLSLPFDFYCLQKDIRDSDLEMFQQCPIHDLRTQLNDFTDTAAIISAMDRVISVDTAVAHLTGALGRPVWILLPHMPDWRWLLHSSDSPWYPTARLFRQSSDHDWGTAITNIIETLRS